MKNLLTILKLHDKMESIVQLVAQITTIYNLFNLCKSHIPIHEDRETIYNDRRDEGPNAQEVDPSKATGTSRRSFLKDHTATAASVTVTAKLPMSSPKV